VRLASGIVLGAGLVLGGYVGVVYRFMHPELTETQLFLATWPLVVVAIGLMLGGALVFERR
jgi:hypothetical protein